MAQEEVEGPIGLVGVADHKGLPGKAGTSDSKEGKKYSDEKLRQYQLSRLK